MSTLTIAPNASPVPPYYRITVDQYDRMLETGILRDGDPIELINGMLVPKLPKTPEHSYPLVTITKALLRILPDGWTAQPERPIRIPDYDEPEPDIAVLRGVDRDYEHRHPGPEDVALLVEVAVSSIGNDRGIKRELYATAGIPVYWIVNVKQRQLEVYTQPQPSGYRSHIDYLPGQLVPFIIDGNQVGQIAVDDILPRPAAGDGV
jgi:Uma2 family endonuclease